MKEEPKANGNNRRKFIKSISATAVVGGLGIGGSSESQAEVDEPFAPKMPPPFPSPNLEKYFANVEADLHICRGLNMQTSAAGEDPGTCDATSIPAEDLHGCMGGNTCAGLGGCGTGDYATQYWVAENTCGGSKPWEGGTGGCGVPLGSTNTGFICSQLNNAVPPSGQSAYIGVPVWAIARARFEAKMVAAGEPFGNKDKNGEIIGCGGHDGNEWDGVGEYDKGNLPEPYASPVPPRKTMS